MSEWNPEQRQVIALTDALNKVLAGNPERHCATALILTVATQIIAHSPNDSKERSGIARFFGEQVLAYVNNSDWVNYTKENTTPIMSGSERTQ